jgi:hypothetical protein
VAGSDKRDGAKQEHFTTLIANNIGSNPIIFFIVTRRRGYYVVSNRGVLNSGEESNKGTPPLWVGVLIMGEKSME